MEKEYAKDYPIPFHNDVFFKYMLFLMALLMQLEHLRTQPLAAAAKPEALPHRMIHQCHIYLWRARMITVPALK